MPEHAVIPPSLLVRARANEVERARMQARLTDDGAIEEAGGVVLVAVSARLPPANAA